MPDFSMKAHDTLPEIPADLTVGGVAVNLTGATIKFIMAPKGGGPPKVKAPATVVDAVNGAVRYDWIVGDTDTAGSFQAEWQVTFSSGKVQTFPTTSYHTIDILADLDGGV